MSLIEAYIITFIASFCSLVIEMVAGRILAPFVGVSLYTWTSIIGVILAGISIGAYIGGKLIDRYPRRMTLALLLLLSGIAALTIIPLTNMVAAFRFPFSLMWRIFAVTAIIFFIPGCILGTISPVVVRLTLQSISKAGNVIGKILRLFDAGGHHRHLRDGVPAHLMDGHEEHHFYDGHRPDTGRPFRGASFQA